MLLLPPHATSERAVKGERPPDPRGLAPPGPAGNMAARRGAAAAPRVRGRPGCPQVGMGAAAPREGCPAPCGGVGCPHGRGNARGPLGL